MSSEQIKQELEFCVAEVDKKEWAWAYGKRHELDWEEWQEAKALLAEFVAAHPDDAWVVAYLIDHEVGK